MFSDNNHQFFIINMYTESSRGPRIRRAYGGGAESIKRSAFNRRVSTIHKSNAATDQFCTDYCTLLLKHVPFCRSLSMRITYLCSCVNEPSRICGSCIVLHVLCVGVGGGKEQNSSIFRVDNFVSTSTRHKVPGKDLV